MRICNERLPTRNVASLQVMNEAQASLVESSQKIDLIKKAIELLETAIDQTSLSTSDPQSPTSVGSLSSVTAPELPKPAAVTGQLQVRLMGCQNLLIDVPGECLCQVHVALRRLRIVSYRELSARSA